MAAMSSLSSVLNLLKTIRSCGKLSSQLIWERHFPDNLVSFNLHVAI